MSTNEMPNEAGPGRARYRNKPSIRRRIAEKIRAEKRTLRGQLVLSIWIGLAGIFVPLNIIDGIHDVNVSAQRTEASLSFSGSFVYLRVKKWRKEIRTLLETLALSGSVRNMNEKETKALFEKTNAMFPYRSLRLWDDNGDLVAGTHIDKEIDKGWALLHSNYIQSRAGRPSYDIYGRCLSGNPCYVESIPVYAEKTREDSKRPNTPIGVMSISIDLADTGKDSELTGAYDMVARILSGGEARKSDHSPWKTPISLQNKDYDGMEILIVSKEGYVIFPTSGINDYISLQSPKEIAKGPWGPLVKTGLKATKEGDFNEIKIEGKDFFAYTRIIDSDWNLVAISDKNSSYHYVYDQISEQIIYQLITLIGLTFVAIIISRKAAQPILLAATVVREFSRGNFEARISTVRTDEIGQLLKDINQTGSNLRELLISKIKHAATDQQIKTAKSIQKSFIVDTLPTTRKIELVGSFDPAYEIGADWYDALDLGEATYMIIADVCDKGIASALFMSVFRSLIRYSLLDKKNEVGAEGVQLTLKKVVAQVNDYMAANHGESAMFATLFLGAYSSETEELSYVCAGHEIPAIIRSKGVIEKLKPTGPAIGIFTNTEYSANTINMSANEILFMYTDGLVDARSPSNASWGIDRLYKVLEEIEPKEITAKELMSRVSSEVKHHRQDADQFDDLTLLVMKINKTD